MLIKSKKESLFTGATQKLINNLCAILFIYTRLLGKEINNGIYTP